MQREQFELHADIERRHWWFVGRRIILRQLVASLLPPSPERLVVDVGCGTGANIAALAQDYRCVGIDTSRQAIDLARRQFPGVEFLVGAAPGDLGGYAAQARLFLLTDVLEHVADDFEMLSRLLAAASPGSRFLITVPACDALWSRHDESFGHYRRYERRRLERVWTGLPVTPLLVSYFNSRLYWPIRTIRALNRLRKRASGLAGTDFWDPSRPVNALLGALLAGEGRVLAAVLEGRRTRGFSTGASLVAALRREAGSIEVRGRPEDVPPDRRRCGLAASGPSALAAAGQCRLSGGDGDGYND